MSRRDIVRIHHMLDAAVTAVRIAEHPDHALAFQVQALALSRLIEIIGQAAANVPDEIHTAHPEVPWSDLTRTRDRLGHGYFNVEDDLVWDIATHDLLKVIPPLQRIIDEHDRNAPSECES